MFDKSWWRWWVKQRLLKPHLLWRDLWWGFLHRTFCRYDRIKIKTLKPGYHDKDLMMLHACFGLLVDYVEREKPFEWWGWDQSPDEAPPEAVEIKALYSWWKESYLKRETPLDQLPDELRPKAFSTWKKNPDGGLSFGPEERTHEELEYPAYTKAFDETCALENKWEKEDDEMLMRLVKIRPYLWT